MSTHTTAFQSQTCGLVDVSVAAGAPKRNESRETRPSKFVRTLTIQ